MPTSLRGIANRASSDKDHRFRNLFGLLTVMFLLSCWERVNKKAASGVDRVLARDYAKGLADNVRSLWERVKRGSYRDLCGGALRRPLPRLAVTFSDSILQLF